MNKIHKSIQNKGFTLLEILLVIAAIGILASIVLVAINPNKQLAQARNAERRSEINTLYKALEQYLIEKQGYPSGITGTEQDICINGNTSNCVNLGVLVPDYVAGIPVDPAGTSYKIGIVDGRVRVRSAGAELGVVIALSGSGGTVLGSTGPSDPHWNNVSLLMKFDGANGSTTFTDSSSNNVAITRVGNGTISTAQAKFGQSYLNGSRLEIPTSASSLFSFTGNFTIELWYYQTNRFSYDTLLELGSYDNGIMFRNGDSVIYVNGQLLNFNFGNMNEWVHVAVVRSGTTFTAYRNGISIGTLTVGGTIGSSLNFVSYIGDSTHASGRNFSGYIDELRITKGVARYTANFTPPTESFPTN